MKKILVPTDFSRNAVNALQYAIELAKIFDSKITLIHTFLVLKRSDMMVSIDELVKKQAEKEMQALVKAMPSDLSVDTKIINGESVRSIAEFADQEGFDLIVMGTKGATGLKKVFIGSTTGGVMRHTRTPILAIPEQFTYRPIRKIVFALANIKLSSEEIILPIVEMVRQLGAKIQVYHHVRTSEKAEREKLLETIDWLKELPYTFFLEEDDDHFNENISDFVKENEADLLCLVRHARGQIGFFERLFQSSVTLTQVFNCDVPLLILQDN